VGTSAPKLTPATQSPDPGTSPEEGKKKRKRLLLLLLLLLITFTAAFLGLGGLGMLGIGNEHDVAASTSVSTSQPTISETPAAIAEPEAKKTEAAPKAEEHAAAKPVAPEEKDTEEALTPAAIPARIADVTSPETQYNITYPELIAPPAGGAKSKTNFVSFEVNAKLAEDPDTRVFSMVPSAPGLKGTAALSWSTVSGSVLFRCKDLVGNPAGSNYVLYYIDDNDKAQRMMAFSVASGAELMLIPPRIPSRTVKRVVLTLEKSVKTLEGQAVRREEVLYSDYKEKAILTKPLK
jgi:hypothetical protein